MSARQRRTARDDRRRTYGQNFLVDDALIKRFVGGLDLRPDDVVLDIGAGAGALTAALADAGVEVWAIEPDPTWVARLRASTNHGTGDVRVIATDIRRLRLPRRPYRVVANPPFGMTTELLALLLDAPERGPERVDVIVQREVARKHAAMPPQALRTAAWLPWWQFELGMTISRDSFRPRPSVDASVLTIRRRTPPLLPDRLAGVYLDALRPAWTLTT